MHVITEFGDLAVLIPLTLLLTLALWGFESARAALYFVLAVAACGLLMFVLKMVFLSCGHYWSHSLNSPSGHSAMSMMVYGAVAVVLAIQIRSHWRWPVVLLIGLWPLAIAVSRVEVGVHSVPEVIVGALVGLLCLALFARSYWTLPHPRFNTVGISLVLVVVALALHGLHAPAEVMLRHWAFDLRSKAKICPAEPAGIAFARNVQ